MQSRKRVARSTTGSAKGQKRASPAAAPVETCTICLEDLKPAGTEPTARLACSHEFHVSCLKQLQTASCPTCRAPLEATAAGDLRAAEGRLTATDVEQIRQRERTNILRRNEEAAAEYADDIVISESQGAGVVRVLALAVPMAQWPALLAFCTAHDVPQAIHDAVHRDVFGDTHLGCDTVNGHIMAALDFFCTAIDVPATPEQRTWFLRHCMEPTAHMDAIAAFPDMTVDEILANLQFGNAVHMCFMLLRRALVSPPPPE
jgi:hypothetical protein